MFWNKKKVQIPESTSLLTLATRLGVERRLNARTRYPVAATVCKLPEVFYRTEKMRVQDISVGGCCLLDPDLRMGPGIGQEIELDLHWPTGNESIKARIVARVDNRRHIQFLDLSANRKNQLQKSMLSGMRATSIRQHGIAAFAGPRLSAVEIWSSPHKDSVILENEAHRMAQVFLDGQLYMIFRQSWPNRDAGSRCTRPEFEQIILFLVNIPYPSPSLKNVIAGLEKMFLGESK